MFAKRKTEQPVDYERQIERLKETIETLTERNRVLEATVSEYRAKEQAIADSLIQIAQQKRTLLEEEEKRMKTEQKSDRTLAKKCRALLNEVQQKYPAASDLEEFESFTAQLEESVGGVLEEVGFSPDEWLKPEKDLAQLCRNLGVMD
ncbi:MAG: hypothetical protein J5993_01325 [Clostridia bacterium]|nr:hypothetical protein [Clostridia bacterium]